MLYHSVLPELYAKITVDGTINPTALRQKVEDEHERVQQEHPDLNDEMHQYVVEPTVWRALCEYLLTFNSELH